MINKVATLKESVDHVKDGCKLLIGGFGLTGVPLMLVKELEKRDVKDITTVSEDAGFLADIVPFTAPKLLEERRIKKLILSFLGGTVNVQKEILAGNVELELVPQGTLAERIRCGGMGIGGFYTPTSVGTDLEKGKEVKNIDGTNYVLELPIHGDVAFVKAHKADKYGNLVFEYAARNFNPLMAMAADIVIVQADHIVEPGEIRPDQVHLPGVFVTYVVPAKEGNGND